MDSEILVSCQTLKNWDLIHPTFGHETITNYMNRCKNNSNLTRHRMTNKIKDVSQLYSKSQVSTDDLLNKVPKDCVNLRDKILKNNHEVFKEKLGPEDRVNCPPVKLETDHSRGIKPVENTKAFDIPIHLRKAATA